MSSEKRRAFLEQLEKEGFPVVHFSREGAPTPEASRQRNVKWHAKSLDEVVEYGERLYDLDRVKRGQG